MITEVAEIKHLYEQASEDLRREVFLIAIETLEYIFLHAGSQGEAMMLSHNQLKRMERRLKEADKPSDVYAAARLSAGEADAKVKADAWRI